MTRADPDKPIEEITAGNSSRQEGIVTPPKKATKFKAFSVVLSVLLIAGFYLPWIKVNLFGFTVYSISGAAIPGTSDMYNDWSYYFSAFGEAGSMDLLYLLYLIPLFAVVSIVFELLDRPIFRFYSTILAMLVLLGFIAGVSYNVGLSAAFAVFDIGIYLCFICGLGLMVLPRT